MSSATNVYVDAVKKGNLDLLKQLRIQSPSGEWHILLHIIAAKNGRLDIIQWLRAQNPPCPWNESTCSWAAANGHIHVLEWIRAQDPPCPWDELTSALAVSGGHSDILEWIRIQEPPCSLLQDIVHNICQVKSISMLSWLICCDRDELPLQIPRSYWYNDIVRPTHSLLVIELLEDIHLNETCNGDIIPKDVVRLIGSYANTHVLPFDTKAKTNLLVAITDSYCYRSRYTSLHHWIATVCLRS